MYTVTRKIGAEGSDRSSTCSYVRGIPWTESTPVCSLLIARILNEFVESSSNLSNPAGFHEVLQVASSVFTSSIYAVGNELRGDPALMEQF